MVRLSRVSAALVGVALLAASPAHADRWSAPDPAGDVTGWHWAPEPEPCGTMTDVGGSAEHNEDITRLSANHLRHRLRIVARFDDLDETIEQQVSFYIQTPRRGWDLDVIRYRAGGGRFRVMTSFTRAPQEPDPSEVDECGSWGYVVADRRCTVESAIDYDAETVTVTVPRTCFGSTAWVQVGVGAHGWTADDPDYPATGGYGGFSDEWGVPEEGDTSIAPPVGPRLRTRTGIQLLPSSNR